MAFNLILFYLFAAIAVGATLLVVVQSNPVYSVLLLIASFIGLGGLYVLLDAPFVAVVQIIVYAGAIMVLFLFVVMLLNAPREEIVQSGMLESGGTRAMGGLLAMAFAAELAWALTRSRTLAMTPAGDRPSYSVAQIGQRLFQEYAFAFEATSILILVAMVGALTLAGRHLAERNAVPNPQSLIPNPSRITMAELNHYLILSGVLFTIGTAGVLLRRNVITVLLSIEVMLNAVNLTFIAFGHFLGSSDGQIIVFFVITVAAAEAAVGLALVIALFRHVETLNPDAFRQLRG